MRRSLWLVAPVVSALVMSSARADEKQVNAVLDKAIKALGGEEKLAKATNASWKVKGTISFNETDNPISSTVVVSGLDKMRNEFEMEFGGNQLKGVIVLKGDKSWRKIGDMIMEVEGEQLATEKRNLLYQLAPITILPLKGKGFKLESADDAKVNDKAVAVIKVTAPDGKDFQISFDKESGLPVRVTGKVTGFQGEEFTQETTYSDFKDFEGIKKATKIVSTRDGEKFVSSTLSDFKVLEKADPESFTEPK